MDLSDALRGVDAPGREGSTVAIEILRRHTGRFRVLERGDISAAVDAEM
jgi:hypothetical protein